MMVRKLKVAIVDDHPVVRRGLKETFSEEPDFQVVAEGATADDAVQIAGTSRPDLLILDVTMPGGGVEAAGRIAAEHPSVAVLMLSIREELATVRAALKAGARGYISKGVDGADLVASARRIIAGERFVSPALAARLIAGDDGSRTGVPPAGSERQLPPLTMREQQIFDLLGLGLGNLAIAERLGLSENTVKHYMTPLLHKLGVQSRTEAAVLARDCATASPKA